MAVGRSRIQTMEVRMNHECFAEVFCWANGVRFYSRREKMTFEVNNKKVAQWMAPLDGEIVYIKVENDEITKVRSIA